MRLLVDVEVVEGVPLDSSANLILHGRRIFLGVDDVTALGRRFGEEAGLVRTRTCVKIELPFYFSEFARRASCLNI